MMTRRSITAVLGCALLAGSAVVAMPAQAAPSVRVGYADLDLSSAAGQRTLARRISGAAAIVCPQQTGDLFAQLDCRRVALGRAHADLARAGVTAF